MDEDTPQDSATIGSLRFLKGLVTVLTAVMIGGVLTIIVLLVIRLQTPVLSLDLPAAIRMPDDTRATAFTRGPGWLAVVTEDSRILVFDPSGETLRQEIRIDAAD